jgi:tetratricopeptide (TPR) repeat protein
MRAPLWNWLGVGCWLLGLLAGHPVMAQEQKTFIAFSMRVAQERVAEALRQRLDFRAHQPELFYLGGITKPWAVVLDTTTGDWILLGERDPQAAVLTLDDWVVALRARFIHPERDPGVSIDPLPSEACRKAGKQESCRDATRQTVRFFGGIEDTHFGQVCYEADWLMKKLGLALEKVAVPGLKPYYALAVEQAQRTRSRDTRVRGRFWFYPIVNRVNVVGDVVLLEQFQMGVFTEVLYAEVNGRPVQDLNTFTHSPSEGFSRSFSEHYDAVARARDVFETLRGLTRLAALAKGLTQVAAHPRFDFYLQEYSIKKVQTPHEVAVLWVQNQEVGLVVSGGASLMALVLRMQGGDTGALQELVLRTRPTQETLSWEFEVTLRAGNVVGVSLPADGDASRLAGPLFAHARFLFEMRHYDAAIEGFSKVIELFPHAVAYTARGGAYAAKGAYAQALADYSQALEIDPQYDAAYNNRGEIHRRTGQYDQALADLNQALQIHPAFAIAHHNRGLLYVELGQYDRAFADFNRALVLDSQAADTYVHRGVAYGTLGQYDQAIADFNRALAIHPQHVIAYINRGHAYQLSGQYASAIADFSQALALDPQDVVAFLNRGRAYAERGQYDQAIADCSRALALDPQRADAHMIRGFAYEKKRETTKALADYNQVLKLNANPLARHLYSYQELPILCAYTTIPGALCTKTPEDFVELARRRITTLKRQP